MNHAYPPMEMLRVSKRLGLTWFRDWSLKWHQVEPEKGRFDFTAADFQIGRVLEEGLNVLGLLPFRVERLGVHRAGLEMRSQSYPATRARTGWLPRDLDEYADYVRRTVEHYRGRVHVWEILNEPIYTGLRAARRLGYTLADYVKLLKVAYQAVKEVQPDAVVIGGIAGRAGDLHARSSSRRAGCSGWTCSTSTSTRGSSRRRSTFPAWRG